MISWLLTNWITQILWLLAAIWFANGLRKAIMRPRVTYVTHSEIDGHGTLLTVKRQELLPPWRTLEEVWLLEGEPEWACTRELDGLELRYKHSDLAERLFGLLTVQEARAKETETLST